MIADIEKAFLQIMLDAQDRDCLRLFWYTVTPSADEPLPQVETWRMTRVPFGATCSTFLLAATINHHLRSMESTYPSTTSRLKCHFYVDDLVLWRTAGDNISCSLSSAYDFIKPAKPTKRHVLRSISRIFNRFGLLAPFAITAKILFQTLWKEYTPWDDVLLPLHSTGWNTWCAGIPKRESYSLPRLLDLDAPTSIKRFSLHVFCDASPGGFGTVASLRNPDVCRVNFVAAKSRVAPLKTQSLPRLKLMAALLAARLAHTVSDAFSLQKENCTAWTDSMIVLDIP
ncbi:uncharacterized protein LOC135389208 [Ornithodoros turicata]|uniref:uncharacterized protein LOC135389208 n=1 Tax=Ornithodoros turicata TaxID=34597 RepID=UPI0031387EFE